MNSAQQVQVLEANEDHNYVIIQRPGFRSNMLLTRTINIPRNKTVEDFHTSMQLWRDGKLVQDAFYWLSADDREFMLSGCTPEMWDAIVG